jgi:hypothetical protein
MRPEISDERAVEIQQISKRELEVRNGCGHMSDAIIPYVK